MKQQRPHDGLEVRATGTRGDGVFTTRAFVAGETVLVGVIEEVLEEGTSHSSQIGENTHVLHGGLVPMVNHSCDPNCGIRVNDTGAHDFVAMQDIAADEEPTFDYAMRNYSVDHFPRICQCGARNCRGSVTGWKSLTPERKADYRRYVAPYLLDLDKAEAV
jgi:hypothetical protein